MSDYQTTADLNEELHYEKLDADRLQAQYEAEGAAYARRQEQVEALLKLARRCKREGAFQMASVYFKDATKLCAHGHVGLLKGACSEGDARYGEDGYRCYECGAVVDEIHGRVLEVT